MTRPQHIAGKSNEKTSVCEIRRPADDTASVSATLASRQHHVFAHSLRNHARQRYQCGSNLLGHMTLLLRCVSRPFASHSQTLLGADRP